MVMIVESDGNKQPMERKEEREEDFSNKPLR